MSDTAFECMRKAGESTFRMQQDMFKQLVGAWPGVPPSRPATAEQILRFQRKWAEIMCDLARNQTECFEAQFKAGLINIEEAFRLGTVKDPEELRARTVGLWQKTFDCLRRSYEAQLRNFQTAATRWAEVTMKAAAGYWAAS
jgi:hypothetical protein